MSSGNKVYKFRCNTCQREVEQVMDNRRADPLRCIITNLCKGTLELQSTRRGDRAKLTVPQTDLIDRIPRGSTLIEIPAVEDIPLIGLTTFNSSNGLTLAGPKRAAALQAVYSIIDENGQTVTLEVRPSGTLYPTDSHIEMLVYELTAAVLTSQKYTYDFRSVAQLIEGVDDSKERRLLRFTALDSITVIINGVELNAAEYDRTVNDTIRLTPSIIAADIAVEVYVYRNRTELIDEAKLIRLKFAPLSETDIEEVALRQGCSWGNIGRLRTPDNVDRALLFCTDLSALDERKTYGVARFEATGPLSISIIIEPSQLWLLLADAPYSFIDRRTDAVINGSALADEQFSFTFSLSAATGIQEPTTTAASLTQLAVRLTPIAEANVLPLSLSGAERFYTRRPEAHIIGPA